jgi:hypothetical protein
MTDEETMSLGNEARIVLGNRAYQTAYEQVERVLVDELAKAELSKDRGEYLRQLLVSGRKHRQLLELALANGNFVAESLRQEQERKKWWNRAA